MHVHSDKSHDGKRSLETIAKDAQAAGMDLVIVTDHSKSFGPSYYSPEGVLMVAATEMNENDGHVIHLGDLAIAAHPDSSKAPLSDAAVLATNGYELLSGSSDFYRTLKSLRAPWLLTYPMRADVALSTLYPERALGAERYDRLTQQSSLRLTCGADDHGRIGSIDRLRTYVTYFPTFIPMRQAEEDARAVQHHLALGETYCALGLYGDASPLSITVSSDSSPIASTGGEHRLPVTLKVRWVGLLPEGHRFYVLKDGKVFKESPEPRLDVQLREPGVYRVELGRDVSTLFGHRHVRWIYANPIFVRAGLAAR